MEGEALDLQSMVATAILVNNAVGQALIEVEERDGCITLKGSAESEKDRIFIEDVVSSQEGVVSVINNIICP